MVNTIQDIIKQLRKSRNLTQEQLAREAGIAYSTVAKIERGAIKDPSFSTIVAMADALDTTLDELLIALNTASKPFNATSEIKFVYCDVNGVLVRFFQKAFVTMAEEYNRSPDLVETAVWHYNAAANKGEMTMDEFNKAVAIRLRLKEVDWEKHYMDAIEKVDAMHKCLHDIKGQVELGLLTNIMPKFLGIMTKKSLLPDIKYKTIVDSSVVGAVKPETEIYKIAQKQSGRKASEILFIDDSRTNLMEAEKFGWRVLWFDDYRPEESVKRVQSALGIGR